MDYGKTKFGGPFTEEEVEDVKTVLRLIPLVICLTANYGILVYNPVNIINNDKNINVMLNTELRNWLFPVLLIPLYQLLLYRCFQKCSFSMLQYIGAGLIMSILGYVLMQAAGIWDVVVSDDEQRYLSCTRKAPNTTEWPDSHVEWYWKLGPFVIYGFARAMVDVLFLEFIIAQSPEKMKGLFFGITSASGSFVMIISIGMQFVFTLCYDVLSLAGLVGLFVVFLVLSKRYTLRERNREINIQAIVEEHYERYLDQEEEYIRENPQYFESIESDSDDDSDTHSTK